MTGSPSSPLPRITLANHQDRVPLQLETVERRLPKSLSLVQEQDSAPRSSVLPSLEEVEISVLDDPEIARQHGAFLADATATDVITFDHGELLVSAETAAREAEDRGIPVERELLLYVIHGLLHLHGYDDHEEEVRQVMHEIQEAILNRVWPE